MKVNIDIDQKYDGTFVTIHAKEWSHELEELVKSLNSDNNKKIVGREEDKSILLSPNDIEYVYAQNRKVQAVIHNRTIELNMKLYEVEEILSGHDFNRFSKSVIGNLNHIKYFELAFNGNLCVFFQSGSKEYVSRKYVNDIKEKLIMGG
ncbi:LytTR family DNA-binding domain-containing protein [Tenuibacillus multivorans]|uniref:LytTr DNA-binding domain-containing protein n=1 Tax=Tenuibacillus multivorans TaxID=237069 RepID=A0A1G9YKQ7_9BACI|nr:LytTR family DNA-binding domain-containing protein [Tenuibacillus multivorans]GEL78449.1 transcriptional regulator [Tenuibacillus multivorans]SDN09552.1 LytTr DNA-binding domain-containing protein [Tenuibacillus multivorans]